MTDASDRGAGEGRLVLAEDRANALAWVLNRNPTGPDRMTHRFIQAVAREIAIAEQAAAEREREQCAIEASHWYDGKAAAKAIRARSADKGAAAEGGGR